jgi:tape measure domain-containing protein
MAKTENSLVINIESRLSGEDTYARLSERLKALGVEVSRLNSVLTFSEDTSTTYRHNIEMLGEVTSKSVKDIKAAVSAIFGDVGWAQDQFNQAKNAYTANLQKSHDEILRLTRRAAQERTLAVTQEGDLEVAAVKANNNIRILLEEATNAALERERLAHKNRLAVLMEQAAVTATPEALAAEVEAETALLRQREKAITETYKHHLELVKDEESLNKELTNNWEDSIDLQVAAMRHGVDSIKYLEVKKKKDILQIERELGKELVAAQQTQAPQAAVEAIINKYHQQIEAVHLLAEEQIAALKQVQQEEKAAANRFRIIQKERADDQITAVKEGMAVVKHGLDSEVVQNLHAANEIRRIRRDLARDLRELSAQPGPETENLITQRISEATRGITSWEAVILQNQREAEALRAGHAQRLAEMAEYGKKSDEQQQQLYRLREITERKGEQSIEAAQARYKLRFVQVEQRIDTHRNKLKKSYEEGVIDLQTFINRYDRLQNIELRAKDATLRALARRRSAIAVQKEQEADYKIVEEGIRSREKTELARAKAHEQAQTDVALYAAKQRLDTFDAEWRAKVAAMRSGYETQKAVTLNGETSLQALQAAAAEKEKKILLDLEKAKAEIRQKYYNEGLGQPAMRGQTTKAVGKATKALTEAYAPVQQYMDEQRVIDSLLAAHKNLTRSRQQELEELARYNALVQKYGPEHRLVQVELVNRKEKEARRRYSSDMLQIEQDIQNKLIRTDAEAAAKRRAIESHYYETLRGLAAQRDILSPTNNEFHRLNRGFSGLLKYVFETYVAWGAVNRVATAFSTTIRDIIPVGIALDSVRATLTATMGSAAGAEAAINALNKEASRTGKNISELRKSFTTFQASTSLAGISTERTWTMFTKLNAVMTALHKSADETQHVYLALSQIFNKSKVQSEELVKQLGNLLPGAFAAFAESMGILPSELSKKMKDGMVFAQETMDGFIDYMHRKFAPSFAIAATMLNADIERMKNELILLQETLYRLSEDKIQDFVRAVTDGMRSFRELASEGKTLRYIIDGLQVGMHGLAGLGVTILAVKFAELVKHIIEAQKYSGALLGTFKQFASTVSIIGAAYAALTESLHQYNLEQSSAATGTKDFFTNLRRELKETNDAGNIIIRLEEDPDVRKLDAFMQGLAERSKDVQTWIKSASQVEVDALRDAALAAQDVITTQHRREVKSIVDSMRPLAEKQRMLKALHEEYTTDLQDVNTALQANVRTEKGYSLASAALNRLLGKQRETLLDIAAIKMRDKTEEEATKAAETRYKPDPTTTLKRSDELEAEATILGVQAKRMTEMGDAAGYLKVKLGELDVARQAASAKLEEKFKADIAIQQENMKAMDDYVEAQRKKGVAESVIWNKTDLDQKQHIQEQMLRLFKEHAAAQAKLEYDFGEETRKAQDDMLKMRLDGSKKTLDAVKTDLQEKLRLAKDYKRNEEQILRTEIETADKEFAAGTLGFTDYYERLEEANKRINAIQQERLAQQQSINTALEAQNNILTEASASFDKMIVAVRRMESSRVAPLPGTENITSPKGARGTMQVTPIAWKEVVGDVKGYATATAVELDRVGQEYFAKQLRRFKDFQVAVMAYNMGDTRTSALYKRLGIQEGTLDPTALARVKTDPSVPEETRGAMERAQNYLLEGNTLLKQRQETIRNISNELNIQQNIEETTEAGKQRLLQLETKRLGALAKYTDLTEKMKEQAVALSGAQAESRLIRYERSTAEWRKMNLDLLAKGTAEQKQKAAIEEQVYQTGLANARLLTTLDTLSDKQAGKQVAYESQLQRIQTLQSQGSLTELEAAIQTDAIVAKQIKDQEALIAKLKEKQAEAAKAIPGGMTNVEVTTEIGKAQATLDSLQLKSTETAMVMKQELTQAFRQPFEAFIQGTLSAGDAAKQFASNVLQSFQRILTDKITQSLADMFMSSGAGKGLMGFVTGLLTGSPTPSAKGNIVQNGSITPFASGGIVTSPTLFPLAKGTGLMGEAGPEAIIPLKRNREGKLGVAGGQQTSYNTVNNISVTIEKYTGNDNPETTAAKIAEAISRKIAKEEIASASRKGGRLAPVGAF